MSVWCLYESMEEMIDIIMREGVCYCTCKVYSVSVSVIQEG